MRQTTGTRKSPGEKIVKDIKRATRKHYSSEEKIRIVLDVATISEQFGWLPHSTRAALTGLRKSGYELSSEKQGNGKPSRYRITGKPTADAA